MSADNKDTQKHLTISACIATHERAFLLRPTLEALAKQSRLPDEIVISDSSLGLETEQVVALFQEAYPDLTVKYVKSECKALPWHRWNGFQHSQGQVVLFLDDDITLENNAIHMLDQAYLQLFARYGVDQIAGIGFHPSLDDGNAYLRRPASFEERWLGISALPSASITSGGLGIRSASMPQNDLVEVGRLSGGCMSFRREVLEQIGLLSRLVDLFNQRIGPGEDIVLSYYASLYGKLFMLTYSLAVHPGEKTAVHTVDARGGWHSGMKETLGRAHTMRWVATDLNVYPWEWLRVATLELFRSLWWGILRRPFSFESWTRLAGALYGTGLALVRWKKIPSSTSSYDNESALMRKSL